MATPPSFTYSGVVYVGNGSTTEFALTSTAGKAIGYLLPEHISVSTSTDDGATWTTLNTPADYTFSTQGTRVVLGTAPVVDTWLRLLRTTPMDANWVDYQSGNLLTAGQLNEFETWQLYIDQELDDSKASIDGSTPGAAVKSVTGTAPIEVDNTNAQTPVIGIDETDSTGDPNALTSDTRVMSEKAIDEAFKQYIGTSPTTGEKVGQIRIDDTGAVPVAFYWSGSAWVQLTLQGPEGPQGPAGPAPGLQDPAASAANVPLNSDGSLGTATAMVEQDPTTKDLKFLFGVPVGQKGDKGDDGADSTVPGPKPGLQFPAALAYNIANQPDGSVGPAVAEVTQNGNGDLQFNFGIPEGIPGPEGPPGEGVDYKGAIDATDDPEPSTKRNGDFYVNTTTGTSTWPGLTDVTQNDRLIWNGNTNQWDRYVPPPITGVDLAWSKAVNSGTVENSAGLNAVLTVVDGTYAGLMHPTEHTKLAGIEAGAQVNPDLSAYLQSGDNVSELTNDAGYITASDIPAAPTLQSVLDEGNTSTTDLWIGTGGETVKLLGTGTVEASEAVKINTNKSSGRPGLSVDGDISMNAGGYSLRFYNSGDTIGNGDGYTLIQREGDGTTSLSKAGGWGRKYFFSADEDFITLSNDNSNGRPSAITGGTAVVHVYNGLNTQFGTNSSQLGNVAPLNDWGCYPARS